MAVRGLKQVVVCPLEQVLYGTPPRYLDSIRPDATTAAVRPKYAEPQSNWNVAKRIDYLHSLSYTASVQWYTLAVTIQICLYNKNINLSIIYFVQRTIRETCIAYPYWRYRHHKIAQWIHWIRVCIYIHIYYKNKICNLWAHMMDSVTQY